MEIKIKISSKVEQPYLVLYTSQITENIKATVRCLQEKSEQVVTGKLDEKIMMLNPNDIYLVRVEEGNTIAYLERGHCEIKKRLYEIEDILKDDFMRISKSTIINLNQINYVKPSFNGLMVVKMKNGEKDFISRKYLPSFKKQFGL